MPRSPPVKTFPSALIPFVLNFVRAQGRDPSRLERKYLRGPVPEGAALPEISLVELHGLMADAAEELDDPLFGLNAALAMPRGAYGLLEFALRSAESGRKAMEQLAQFGALINPLVRWSVEVDGDDVSLHHRAPRTEGVGRQGNYFTVARIVAIARELLGEDVRPLRAWFAHPEKSCPPALQAYLGTSETHFGRASNGVTFSAASLERVPGGADPELNRMLHRHASALLEHSGADDVVEQTRRAVRELLSGGDASLAKVAKRLHLSGRTLQRRLEEEGLVFAVLVGEVRRDEAERLLRRTAAPIAEIAEAVGYADAGAFVRAFRRWTGTTPGRFRDQVA